MRKAFTLVELLAVIAVIAVLAGILFPAFARARENARRVKCVSNLRQIGTAIDAYRADYEQAYPLANRNDKRRGPYLRDTLAAYVTDSHIWICDSDIGETFISDPITFARKTPPFWKWLGSSYDYYGIGYTEQLNLLDGRCGGRRFPTLMPAVREIRPWHGYPGPSEKYLHSPARYNVLYADGHVGRPVGRDIDGVLMAAIESQ